MESSYITGTGDDGEGCNSCESGWTMYLASPGDDDYGGKGSGSDGSNVDDGYGYRYIVHGRKGGKEYHDDGDDNDSLASDASTEPAKGKVQPSSPDGKAPGRGKHGATDDDDDDDKDGEKPKEEEGDTRTSFSTSSRKKAGNKAEKGGEGKSSKRGHGKKGSSSRTSFFW